MPNVATVHQDAALTNLAIGYASGNLISERLYSDLPVNKRSDLYYIFDAARRAVNSNENVQRAPGAAAREVDFAVTTGSYICADHALKAIVPDEEKENADPVIRPMIDKTEFLVQQLLTNQEVALAAALVAGVTATSDPTNEWDDYTNGDPAADMLLAINTIEDAIGIKPNVCAMDSKVWRAVKSHPDILERIKYTGTAANPAVASPQGFAELFELDELIVGSAFKNTAIEGQTANISRIWGSDVYLAYRPPNPGLKIPALGYRFVWRPFSGSLRGWMVRQWRDNERRGDLVEVSKYYDQKVTLAAAAYRLQNRLT